jgi:hypothetical protein
MPTLFWVTLAVAAIALLAALAARIPQDRVTKARDDAAVAAFNAAARRNDLSYREGETE